ncbi:hypothetical protein AMAG_17275 [Allomyces macrogynus ATCC 38327]|uniref:Uncharacterized protein n=1 Tax=Allomyces macrogynus (strain ATCC 38327) TaxID=578462 RepID=A0A0L0TEP0_ALLM3|nr:hypothetical protein AMAG_17275 [Allomyces macrogynus ATCC 38327]|eukprot:KNE73126.1 hypothetical protein AMAG_17275 [Allomyces macrogynus ATCC 38327]
MAGRPLLEGLFRITILRHRSRFTIHVRRRLRQTQLVALSLDSCTHARLLIIMGKSAKVKKRPSRKAKEITQTVQAVAKGQSSNSKITKAKVTPAKSVTTVGQISRGGDAMAVDGEPSRKKLGKYEISEDRPDYVDLLSGKKTFSKATRKLLK